MCLTYFNKNNLVVWNKVCIFAPENNKSKIVMDKIFYIDSSILSKCKRSKWDRYTIVMIEEKLAFGKVKVSTWGFDIPFAYAPVNHVGYDVVEENDIKELNWYNILNDFQKDYDNRKYTIWHFLKHNYHCDSSLIDCFNKDKITYQVVYWDDVEIAKREYDNNNLPEWCKGQDILWEIDRVIEYMIDHNIEKENAMQLKELIRTDPVTITTEEYLRMKGYID